MAAGSKVPRRGMNVKKKAKHLRCFANSQGRKVKKYIQNNLPKTPGLHAPTCPLPKGVLPTQFKAMQEQYQAAKLKARAL